MSDMIFSDEITSENEWQNGWGDHFSPSSVSSESNLSGATILNLAYIRWGKAWGSYSFVHSSSFNISSILPLIFFRLLPILSNFQMQSQLLSILSPFLATLLSQAGPQPTISLPCSETLLRSDFVPNPPLKTNIIMWFSPPETCLVHSCKAKVWGQRS